MLSGRVDSSFCAGSGIQKHNDLNSFTNEFAHIISSLENNNSHFIFAGDFNINLLKLNENDTYSSLFDTIVYTL